MVTAEELQTLLSAYAPQATDVERDFLPRYAALLSEAPLDFWKRTHFTPGHITASAWVVNKERTHVLLIHHKGAGMWFQPGGHVEAEDAHLSEAILREVQEETGLVGTIDAHIFDIDIHSIAARPQRGEPAHEHFDIRVLVEVAHETRAVADDGILGVRWFPLSEVSSINNTPSVTRMVSKTKPVH